MKKTYLTLGTLLALVLGSLPVLAACPCSMGSTYKPYKTQRVKTYQNRTALRRQPCCPNQCAKPCPCPAAPITQPCCPNQCAQPCPCPAAPIQRTYNDMSD